MDHVAEAESDLDALTMLIDAEETEVPEASGSACHTTQPVPEKDTSDLVVLMDSDFDDDDLAAMETLETLGHAGSGDAAPLNQGSPNLTCQGQTTPAAHSSGSQGQSASPEATEDLKAQLKLLQQQMALLQQKLEKQETPSNSQPSSQSGSFKLQGESSGRNPFFGESVARTDVASTTRLSRRNSACDGRARRPSLVTESEQTPASKTGAKARSRTAPLDGSSQVLPSVPQLPSTSQASTPAVSLTRKEMEKNLFGESDSEGDDDYADKKELSLQGREIKQLLMAKETSRIAHTSSFPMPASWKRKTSPEAAGSASQLPMPKKKPGKPEEDEKVSTDPFSGIRLVTPLVSSSQMAMKMQGRRMMKCSRLHLKVNTPDLQGDWVTMGVIVKKTDPKQSSTGKTFCIWTLSDLLDCDHTCSFFLFGQVFKEHWKCGVGTVVGLLNPSLMDSADKNKSEVAFTITHPNQLMVMGRSKDLGWCQGRTRAGNACTNFVNKQFCGYCTYHVQAAYKRSSSQRTELQAVTGMTPKRFQGKNKKKDDGFYFYGGQTFTFGKTAAEAKKRSISLSRLKQEHQRTGLKNVTTISLNNLAPGAGSASQHRSLADDERQTFMDSLLIPSAGSMNLIRHLMDKEKAKESPRQAGRLVSVTPGQMLKENQAKLKALRSKAQLSSSQPATKGSLSALPSTSSAASSAEGDATVGRPQTVSEEPSRKSQGTHGKKPQAKSSPELAERNSSLSGRSSQTQAGSRKKVSPESLGKTLQASRGPSTSKSGKDAGDVSSKHLSKQRKTSSTEDEQHEEGHRSLKQSKKASQRQERKRSLDSNSSSSSPSTSSEPVAHKKHKSRSNGDLAKASSSSTSAGEKSDVASACGSKTEGKPQRAKTSVTAASAVRDTKESMLSVEGVSAPTLGTASDWYKSSAKPRAGKALVPSLPLPTLGRGLSAGEELFFDLDALQPRPPASKPSSAKLKAIAKVQAKGGLERSNPNATRPAKKGENAEVIKKRVASIVERDLEPAALQAPPPKRSKLLGSVDLQDPEVQRLLKMRSSHAGAVAEAELEREEKFFNELEKKEKMEEKMMSVTEVETTLFSCKQCNYTAFGPGEVCKKENHKIIRFKGKKRFFKCKKCGERTVTFQKFPTKPCKKCGEHSYDRTSMYKERTGPKLASEKLNLRGDEIKFLGSLHEKVYLE